jgi:hypothetical protein
LLFKEIINISNFPSTLCLLQYFQRTLYSCFFPLLNIYLFNGGAKVQPFF